MGYQGRLNSLEERSDYGIMSPGVAVGLQSVAATSNDVVEGRLVAFVALTAELARWVGYVPADFTKVGCNYGVVRGVKGERDDTGSGTQNQVVPR